MNLLLYQRSLLVQVQPTLLHRFVPSLSYLSVAYSSRRQAANPEPTSTVLQVFPTGTFDEFPKDGITLALGPDLRKQIKDAATQNCKDQSSQECRNAIAPLLQNTDVTTHAKRFVVVGAILFGELLVFTAVEILAFFGYFQLNTVGNIPQEIKFSHGDLQQIKAMGGANTFAVKADASATPNTVIFQPVATSTAA
jgi:hypothetical protein